MPGYLADIATAGGGGGLLGALAVWMQLRQSKSDREDSREVRLRELSESIMDEVRKENSTLRHQIERLANDNRDFAARIEVFERRDARVYIIETCFRMVVPELIVKDPRNKTLAHVSRLLRSLPIEANATEWSDLLARIDAADEISREIAREAKSKDDGAAA